MSEPMAKGRPKALIVLMCVGLAALAASLLLPVLRRRTDAQAESDYRHCGHTLRQLGQAMALYATDHADEVPPKIELATADWERPPACARAARRGRSAGGSPGAYVYAAPAGKLSAADPRAVAAYEPAEYHDGTGSTVLFMDGHVEWVFDRDAAWLIAEVQAGRNPPRPRPR